MIVPFYSVPAQMLEVCENFRNDLSLSPSSETVNKPEAKIRAVFFRVTHDGLSEERLLASPAFRLLHPHCA